MKDFGNKRQQEFVTGSKYMMDVSSRSAGVNHKNYILTHEPVEFWEKKTHITNSGTF